MKDAPNIRTNSRTKAWACGALPIFDPRRIGWPACWPEWNASSGRHGDHLGFGRPGRSNDRERAGARLRQFQLYCCRGQSIVDCARVVAPYRAEQPDRLSFLPRKNGSDCDLLDDAWRQATDCYVTIVHSGEKFRSNWLSVCVEFLEANPEMIVGFPDWVLTDGQGNVLQEIRAPDYDLYRMVHDAHCMPGPGALIRRSAVSMPNLRNRSFRLADGYEIWLLLGLQGDFIHIPVVTAARQDNTSGLQARLAEYCRARDVLFKQARLPETVHCWRHTARVVVVAKGPWAGMPLLVLAFSASHLAQIIATESPRVRGN